MSGEYLGRKVDLEDLSYSSLKYESDEAPFAHETMKSFVTGQRMLRILVDDIPSLQIFGGHFTGLFP